MMFPLQFAHIRSVCKSHLFDVFFTALLVVVCVFSVEPARADEVPSFTEDVIPVLTRFGCNTGGCHGKLAGQNGFRLSLRGYAPELDFATIARESRGRRLSPASPEQSLFMRKALGIVPHGGGARIEPGGPAEQLLNSWIAAGAPGPKDDDTRVERIEVSPKNQTLAVGEELSLSVTAIYTDGRRRDVTWLTRFESSDAGALVSSPEGTVRALRNGEAVVRAAFQDQIEIATFTMPFSGQTQPAWYDKQNNLVDEHVFDKLAKLHIEPSPLCDDATFIRRAHLDTIGTLPSRFFVRSASTHTSSCIRPMDDPSKFWMKVN